MCVFAGCVVWWGCRHGPRSGQGGLSSQNTQRVPSTCGRTFGPLDGAGVVQAIIHPHQLLHRAPAPPPFDALYVCKEWVFLDVRILIGGTARAPLGIIIQTRLTGRGAWRPWCYPARARVVVKPSQQQAVALTDDDACCAPRSAHERSIAASDLDEPWDRSGPTGRRTVARYACACG